CHCCPPGHSRSQSSTVQLCPGSLHELATLPYHLAGQKISGSAGQSSRTAFRRRFCAILGKGQQRLIHRAGSTSTAEGGQSFSNWSAGRGNAHGDATNGAGGVEHDFNNPHLHLLGFKSANV